MIYKFINFYRTELVQGITSVSNVMLVPIPDSTKLPGLVAGEAIRMALWDGQQEPEIVDVTQNLQTGQLPILRAKESTTAKDWPAGTQVTAIISAEMLTSFMASFFNVDLLMSGTFLPLSGGVMTGRIRQELGPIAAGDLVNKAYADAQTGDFVETTGDIMAGDLDFAAAYRILRLAHPLLPDHAATKNYVDLVLAEAAKRAADDSGTAMTTGNGTAFVGVTSYSWPSLTQGITVTFRFNSTNAANATFQLNALAAKQIAGFDGANLAANKIIANVPIRMTYIAATDKWHVHDYYPNDIYPGDIKWSGQTADHGAWMLCNGRTLDRSIYATLYNAIGTWYGAPTGTTFSIPDLRGRVAVGKDDMGGASVGRVTTAGSGIDGLTLGANGGDEKITLNSTQIPAHTHPIQDPGHQHNFAHTAISSVPPPALSIAIASPQLNHQTVNSDTVNNTTGISILPNTGGDQPHRNMPPSIILNAFIHI